MRWVLSIGAIAVLLAGCGEDDGSGDSGPPAAGGEPVCVATARFDGTTYRGWLHNPKHVQATKLGMADLAACDDVGGDARGSYFPLSTDQVEVWAFEGYPTSEVIGTHSDDGFLVYMADDVPTKKAESVAAELGESRPSAENQQEP